jgi:hypothetical protein
MNLGPSPVEVGCWVTQTITTSQGMAQLRAGALAHLGPMRRQGTLNRVSKKL